MNLAREEVSLLNPAALATDGLDDAIIGYLWLKACITKRLLSGWNSML